MMMVGRCLTILALGISGWAETGQGIRPRPSSSEYPTHEETSGISVAADLLTPALVRNTFATDLNRGYIVIEVALYPGMGQAIDVVASDFSLRIGTDNSQIRPASPGAIASILRRKSASRRHSGSDIDVYPTVGIGYESGRGYDPITGRTRGGLSTSAGVGIGIGGPVGSPPPASSDRDRTTMQQELEDKALPEGSTLKPVAGYLFLPMPTTKRPAGAYELNYWADGKKIRLLFPRTENK